MRSWRRITRDRPEAQAPNACGHGSARLRLRLAGERKEAYTFTVSNLIQSAPGRPAAAAVVTKAVTRAASALGLSQRELSRVLGVSEATVSRFATGKTLAVDRKETEHALLLVRVFRSLDALVGGSEAAARAWFSAENIHIGGIPRERVQSTEGLVHVAQYLDAMRGKL